MYGPATLQQVEAHAREVAAGPDAQPEIPVRVVHKEVATSPGSIRRVALAANAADDCVGLIAWMDTFSPAKMWIDLPNTENSSSPPDTATSHARQGASCSAGFEVEDLRAVIRSCSV